MRMTTYENTHVHRIENPCLLGFTDGRMCLILSQVITEL
jgi:hypothetical protein